MSTLEDIYEDGKREDREDKMRARLQRRAHPVGSHSLEPPEACEDCSGTCEDKMREGKECPRCLGTGVQP